MRFPPTGLDTNILLRFAVPAYPEHPEVKAAVEALIIAETLIYMTFQNMAEFWNVLTRPLDKGGQSFAANQADAAAAKMEQNFQVLTETPAAYALWRQMVAHHALSGVQVHDARIACVFAASGVTHLLTLNGKDFKRFGIAVVMPADIIAQAQKN